MSKLELVRPVEVGARASMIEVPLQLCMENLEEIGNLRGYAKNVAIRVDNVLLVKDAP